MSRKPWSRSAATVRISWHPLTGSQTLGIFNHSEVLLLLIKVLYSIYQMIPLCQAWCYFTFCIYSIPTAVLQVTTIFIFILWEHWGIDSLIAQNEFSNKSNTHTELQNVKARSLNSFSKPMLFITTWIFFKCLIII